MGGLKLNLQNFIIVEVFLNIEKQKPIIILLFILNIIKWIAFNKKKLNFRLKNLFKVD